MKVFSDLSCLTWHHNWMFLNVAVGFSRWWRVWPLSLLVELQEYCPETFCCRSTVSGWHLLCMPPNFLPAQRLTHSSNCNIQFLCLKLCASPFVWNNIQCITVSRQPPCSSSLLAFLSITEGPTAVFPPQTLPLPWERGASLFPPPISRLCLIPVGAWSLWGWRRASL